MEYSFTEVEVHCGFVTRQTERGYKLSNGTLLLPSLQDTSGYYPGGIGLDGMYLRTEVCYRPLYDDYQQIRAFQKVK